MRDESLGINYEWRQWQEAESKVARLEAERDRLQRQFNDVNTRNYDMFHALKAALARRECDDNRFEHLIELAGIYFQQTAHFAQSLALIVAYIGRNSPEAKRIAEDALLGWARREDEIREKEKQHP